jgi:uncharacterized protein
MTDQPIRAFIDTNIWISAFINPVGPPAAVLAAFETEAFITVISEPFLNELADVLGRTRIRRQLRVSHERVTDTLMRLNRTSLVTYPTGTLQLCRDPKDDVMLETAIQGPANYVVSRDDDIKRDLNLIAHLHEHDIEVVTVAQFLKLLDER